MKLLERRKRKCCSPDELFLGGRCDSVLNDYGTLFEKNKVRFVEQSYKNCDKSHTVHDTATLRAFLIRAVLSAAPYHKFRIFFHKVTQAYL